MKRYNIVIDVELAKGDIKEVLDIIVNKLSYNDKFPIALSDATTEYTYKAIDYKEVKESK